MSKWTLLKAAISGKNDSKDEGRDVSIHRFSGFDVLAKRKIIWQGFQLNLIIEPKNVLENREASAREVADASVVIQNNHNNCNCTYTEEKNPSLGLKEEVRSCGDIEQLKDFIKNAYEFMSAVGCRECLLVIKLVDSALNINKLEDILMNFEARNDFRRQNVSKELTKEHSSSSSAILSPSEDRMMLFQGAYYIQSSSSSLSSTSSVELSKSCQYFVYDLPQVKNDEVEILRVDALQSKGEEGHQSILSDSSAGPPTANLTFASTSSTSTSSSSTSIKEKTKPFPLDNTTDIVYTETKNQEDSRINTIGENIAQKKDEIIHLNLNTLSHHHYFHKQQPSDPESDLIPELDADIVYRMPRIFTREESQSRKISGSGLLSHLIHGVDNTGEKCSVWCGAVWCGAVWCGVVRCGVGWCVVWWDGMWCDVV